MPLHYFFFTVLSVIGSTIVFKEWDAPIDKPTGCDHADAQTLDTPHVLFALLHPPCAVASSLCCCQQHAPCARCSDSPTA